MMKKINQRIIRRVNDCIYLDSNEGEEKQYKILHRMEFSSDRKRMTVIVKMPGSNKIILFTKGAD